jgi:hypothetical protein
VTYAFLLVIGGRLNDHVNEALASHVVYFLLYPTMETNEERQREEITVLQSIYDHDFQECPPPKAWKVRVIVAHLMAVHELMRSLCGHIGRSTPARIHYSRQAP